jgi:hypothetical protein
MAHTALARATQAHHACTTIWQAVHSDIKCHLRPPLPSQPLVCPVYHQEQPHKAAISGLDACGSMAVSASLDDSIRVYDAREGYLRQYACLPLRPNRCAGIPLAC